MQTTPQVDSSSGNFEIDFFRKHYELYKGKRHLIHGSEPFSVATPVQDACINGRLRFLKENIIEIDVVHASALGRSEEFEGSTVLQIATSQMLDLMPPTINSTNCPFISLRDYTILQISYDGCTYENSQEQSISYQPRETDPYKIPVKVANVLLMVFIMAMSYFCEASSHPPDPFQFEIGSGDASRSVTIWDMVTRPSNFQVMFYYMISSMAGFFASMGAVIYLLWSLPLRKVVTFIFIILTTNYILLVDMSMPQFSIRIGSSSISSGTFMGLCAITFIFCGLAASVLMKLCSCFCWIRQGTVSGKVIC